MDWLTFFDRLVATLVWPAVVLFLLWYGRNRVGALFDRMENFEGWGAKVSFRKELDQVEQQLPILEPVRADAIPESAATARERIAATSELPPAYIIQEAWKRVENAIREAANKHGVHDPDDQRITYGTTLKAMNKLGLPPEERKSLNELRQLRNKAVHSLDPEVTLTDALRYRDIADRLVSVITTQT